MSGPVHAHRSPAGGLPHPSGVHRLARHISEDDLLTSILELAAHYGWIAHHCRPARTDKGWRTPVQGRRGFPDLVLAHPDGRLVFAELKSQNGRLTADQVAWRDTLTAAAATCPRARVVEWRPVDWLAGRVQQALAPEVTG